METKKTCDNCTYLCKFDDGDVCRLRNHNVEDPTTNSCSSFKAEEVDMVNRPPHYTSGSIECIDAMVSAYGKEAVINFCHCNAFKYLWRADKKNGIEDLKKAQWYINKMIELKEK